MLVETKWKRAGTGSAGDICKKRSNGFSKWKKSEWFHFRLFSRSFKSYFFLGENRYLDKQLIMNQGFGAFYIDARQG
jgi:hypothetical protein